MVYSTEIVLVIVLVDVGRRTSRLVYFWESVLGGEKSVSVLYPRLGGVRHPIGSANVVQSLG